MKSVLKRLPAEPLRKTTTPAPTGLLALVDADQ
jgi:hypothetical protein